MKFGSLRRSLVGAMALAIVSVLLQAAPSYAAYTPYGVVDWFGNPAPGRLSFGGWAFDPDAPTVPLPIHVYVSGSGGPAEGYALDPNPVSRPDVAAAYPGAGPNQGFNYDLAIKHSGTVTVEVYAIDVDGNALLRDPPAVVYIEPDVTPPASTITSGPSGPIAQHDVSFSFTSGDAVAVQCRWDNGSWNPCASPASGTFGEGGHSFEVRGIDFAGNIESSPPRRTFTVDTSAPDASITSAPSQSGSPPVVSVGIAADESAAQLQCSWDDSAWADCHNPATRQLSPGPHRFAVRAIDPAGNVDAIPAVALFKVRPVLTASATAVRNGGRLLVGVKPNSAAVNYRFRVQRKQKRKQKTRWVTVRRSKTQGRAETRLLNLPRGTYRVIVPDQNDYLGTQSRAVRLRR